MGMIRQTANHPAGKVLRTGDQVMLYGFKAEFVGGYKDLYLFYFPDAHCIESVDDLKRVCIYDPPEKKDIAGKLFEVM